MVNDKLVVRRRKATGPRSKQGCRTCRIRRVKCDEHKPSCQKCTSTGRWCEWFSESPLQEASSSASRSPGTSSFSGSDDQAWYDQPIGIATDVNARVLLALQDGPYSEALQKRSFDYFRQRTVPQLLGVFSDQFWSYVLLQATHHNEALRHAVVALGSLHERFEKSDPTILLSNRDSVQGGYALEQYIRAIRALVNPGHDTRKGDVDVYLVSCLLFASFETLRGHHGSAISHIRSGIRILLEIAAERAGSPGGSDSSRSSAQLIPVEMLAIHFARLESQVRQLLQGKMTIGAARIGNLAPAWRDPSIGFSEEIPDVFESIQQARNAFDYMINDLALCLDDAFRAKHSDPSPPEKAALLLDQQCMIARCERWTGALNVMLTEKPDIAIDEVRAGKMMKLLVIAGWIALSCIGRWDEMAFDQYMPYFEEAVELAATVVEENKKREKQRKEGGGEGKPLPRFQMDTGFTTVLYQVAWRCRDPVIRRKAIQILEDNPWMEGLADSQLVARVGYSLVMAEEGLLGRNLVNGTVPAWARVTETDVSFDREHRCAVVKLKQPFIEPEKGPVWTTWTSNW